MPLLEIIQIRRVTARIRLEESTAAMIDQYAAFLHASPDEVVDKALCYVFAKDRDFQEFLRTPEAGRAPALLRVRCVAASDGLRQPEGNSNGVVKQSQSKPNGGADQTGNRAGMKP